MTRATILVCTRDRAATLAVALRSIIEDHSALDRELLVVDNGSTDATSEVVAEIAATSPFPTRLLRELTVGLSAARNRGVREAKGDYVLFTDDDTRVEDGWSAALALPLSDPGVGAVGGRVLPDWPLAPPPWLAGLAVELLAVRDFGAAARDLGPGALPVGANMAVRRSVLSENPFDVGLGHRGSDLAGYEEVALFSRLQRTHRVVYAPDAIVHHRVDRGRMTRAALRRAAFHNGFGQTRYERLLGIRNPRVAAMLLSLQWGARAASRRLRNDRSSALGVDEAGWEFAFYRELGRHIEAATSGSPGINGWLMRHLA